jgi:hypothetical protein
MPVIAAHVFLDTEVFIQSDFDYRYLRLTEEVYDQRRLKRTEPV